MRSVLVKFFYALGWAVFVANQATGEPGEVPSKFTPLLPLEKPKIVASAEAYPGGGYNAENILDGSASGKYRSEYASAGKGTGTFLDFDFGESKRIAAFEHIDRFDPATVAAADLIFSDRATFNPILEKIPVKHVNRRGGRTLATFPAVTARYVRWQVTAIAQHTTVGGAEISFFTSGAPESVPGRLTATLMTLPVLMKEGGGKASQLAQVGIVYPYVERIDAVLEISGSEPKPITLEPLEQVVELSLPAVEAPAEIRVTLSVGGEAVSRSTFKRRPVRPRVFYFLPHSHVDIGYTHVQTEVERMQWKYFEDAIELARRTADYPDGARFKWNCEVLWAVDSYLKHASQEKKQEFFDAVKKGWLHLDGLYGNELTGLCRPEELFRLVDCARRLSRTYGLKIDAAMITDVPGYTWGIVPALAQSGILYLSMGPNHAHRIGRTLTEWGARPFYWSSPSGKERILSWVAGHGYSWFHPGLQGSIKNVKPRTFFLYLNELEARQYPYDLVQLRYSIGGDNGPPDPDLPEYVKDWNSRYASPRMVIATTRELFQELERRYGDEIPEVRGDFTPYWEDGAASSARETALARTAAERLIQAEALWAICNPHGYPSEKFYWAWRNVLLYNEHTWGAHSSISQPDSPFTKDQWKIKQRFALEADRQWKELLDSAAGGSKAPRGKTSALDVYNTCSWRRTDLVVLEKELVPLGDQVREKGGRPVPSQRLSDGRLAFLAAGVPPLGAKRFLLEAGEASGEGSARAEGTVLRNQHLRIAVNEKTGALKAFTASGIPVDLVDPKAGLDLNEYVYVPGRDPSAAIRDKDVKISVQERGPLMASLIIESEAPGCRGLRRELRVVDGLPRIDLTNELDRKLVREKEGLHFGFAFNVPEGLLRLDIPWTVMRPEVDQLPGACKNYLTVGRWADLSNENFGVSWATLDAPLVEVGAITVDLPNPFDPSAWIERLEPTGIFYSYVMNNYWETNYKADQEGKTAFRYSIWPHGRFDASASSRFALERSQPLVAVPADPEDPPRGSLLGVEPESVLVSSLKPSEDGQALLVRLFNPMEKPVRVVLKWSPPAPERISVSSPHEEVGSPVEDPIDLPGYGIITLRARLREEPVLRSGLKPEDIENQGYLAYARECADLLLEHGTDRYGKVYTPHLMSILDVRTRTCPRDPLPLDEEFRVTRRGRRGPAGGNLYLDQPTLRAFSALSRITGDKRYSSFVRSYLSHCMKELVDDRGFLWWGWHRHYDAYEDLKTGHAGNPHEIHIQQIAWPLLWEIDPRATTREIEAIWKWHIIDKETGECNRHGDGQRGCDFAMSGGEILVAFAFLFTKTEDPAWLDRARLVANYYWNSRNRKTNLIPNRPNAGESRFDGAHFDTSIAGLFCHSLLKAYELTADRLFLDQAVTYLKAYGQYGFDEKAGKFWGSLKLDGTPVPGPRAAGGYGQYEPRGHIDLWEPYAAGYECPIYTAQAYAYAYQLARDPVLLDAARKWAENIRREFPPVRCSEDAWYKEYSKSWAPSGTYAGLYGRTISFFLHLHNLTGDAEDLEFARKAAGEAISKLYYRGLFRGHPRKPYYEAVDGVGYLLYSLIQLDRVLEGKTASGVSFQNW